MFAEHFAAAIEAVCPSQLDAQAQKLWAAHGAGAVSDDDAQALAERIDARRPGRQSHQETPGRTMGGGGRRWSRYAPKRVQHARLHPERISRRRRLVAAGPLPPQLAAKLTPGQTAVLAIVADECRRSGCCDRSLAELAARAGVCRSLAQAAVRLAARLGLLRIEERPQKGRKNLTNVITIVSAEWRTWIARGPHRSVETGSKRMVPTDTILESKRRSLRPFQPFRGSGGKRGRDGNAPP